MLQVTWLVLTNQNVIGILEKRNYVTLKFLYDIDSIILDAF